MAEYIYIFFWLLTKSIVKLTNMKYYIEFSFLNRSSCSFQMTFIIYDK